MTSTTGKLTLKEIYFTYGNNTGRLNSYKFAYSDFNPGYNLHNYDRWGNFMSNDSIAKWKGFGAYPNYDYPAIADYPYTYQDTSITNKFTSAWTLNKIILPSGGEMDVSYEAKDYAYVQDQRAGQMFLIKGFSTDNNDTTKINQDLYVNKNTYGKYIIIDVGVPVTVVDVLNNYLDGVNKQLYYKCLVNLNNDSKYEYVTGYAEIDYSDVGVCPQNNRLIYIKLKDIDGHSPIAEKAWQIIRQNYPDILYPYSYKPGFSIKTLTALVGIFPEAYKMLIGIKNFCINRDYGRRIKTGKSSWVRLYNPGYNKFGGGCRVKSIALNDKWSVTGNGTDASYGQAYDYTELKESPGVSYKVSSGVASYEPAAGGDENSMHKPLSFDVKAVLSPTTEQYLETPLGESMYPAPIIGYKMVTVTSISNATSRTGTGKETHEFYTAYDFPVKTYHTQIANKRFKPRPISLFLSTVMRDFMTVSQGYTIEINDMHGKPKCDKTFNQAGDVIASTKYIYKTNDPKVTQMGLSNNVDFVNNAGLIERGQMGLDIDMWMDMRQQETKTAGVELQVNGDGFIIPFFIPLPSFTPTIWPCFTSEKTRFRSAVSVKFIQQYGILDRVEKMVDGSFAATQNLLYDKETGEVLLTKTTNEFNDSIFNFNYPAHWYYKGMGQAYKNVGRYFRSVRINNGEIDSTYSAYFADGDEVLIGKLPNTFSQKGWVTHIAGGLKLIDYNGNPVSDNNSADLKIIKSGYKNQASSVIGTLALVRKNPVNIYDRLDFTDGSLSITQTSAREFNDSWRTDCEKVASLQCDGIGRYMGENQYCLYDFTKEFLDSCQSVVYYNSLYSGTHLLPNLSTVSPYCDSIQGTPAWNYTWFTTSQPEALPFTARINNCNYSIALTPYGISHHYTTLLTLAPNQHDSTSTDGCINLYDYPDDVDIVATACFKCDSCYAVCIDSLTKNQVINPYRLGLKNNWHEKSVWAYNGLRFPESGTAKPQTDGYIKDYTPFWNFDGFEGNGLYKFSDGSLPWVKTNEITNLNAYSSEIENKDALGIYSAALYGYLGSLPKAVSKNSNYRNMAFDGFEDYNYTLNANSSPCVADFWNFSKGLSGDSIALTKKTAHTGKYSLKLAKSNVITVTRDIKAVTSDTLLNLDGQNIFKLKDGCLNKFSPQTGYYQFSAWVKEDTCCNPSTYNNCSINVSFTGSGTTYTFKASGPIIEGWQRIDTVFQVPVAATQISVKLQSGIKIAYFDDIRITPFNSEMKSFVYDAISTRLMAELDANNYATFYEYDDSGKLIRVKKETERGIMTIKETRSYNIKYK